MKQFSKEYYLEENSKERLIIEVLKIQ